MLASILIPSRKRITYLIDSIESFYKTCSKRNYKNFEAIVCLDFDDTETIEQFHNYSHNKKFIKTIVSTERYGYDNLNKYFEDAYKISCGKWLIPWNDDAKMLSKSWDLILDEYGDNLVMLNPYCELDKEYLLENTMFPIIPRRWVSVTGEFARYNHIDDYIGKLAKLTNTFKNEYRLKLDHRTHGPIDDEVTSEIFYHKFPFPFELLNEDRIKIIKYLKDEELMKTIDTDIYELLGIELPEVDEGE